jgi:quercetin dioxygenase-like cupin family protein
MAVLQHRHPKGLEDTMATETARTIYHPLQRDRVIFLKTAAEIDGELMLIEVELAPGGGNALHYHTSFSERFTPIAGELGVQMEKQQRVLRPGESALVKQQLIHRFYNGSDQPIRFYVEIRPAHVGFEQSLRIGYGLAADGQTNAAGIPKDLLTLAVLIELSDTRLIGPLALLNPIFSLLARIGRRRGVEADLVERYAPHTADHQSA